MLNLDNRLERRIHERLEKYLSQNRSCDSVMELMAQDFPYLDERLRKCCESLVHAHYNLNPNNEQNAVVKKLALLHGNDLNCPFHSHQSTEFMLYGEDDIYVAINIENPLYLHREAQGYYSVHIDGIEVNRFHCWMGKEDRTQSLYIPLKILENDLLELEGPRKRFNVVIKDENVENLEYSILLDIGYSKTYPSDYFKVISGGIHKQGWNEFEDTFREDELKSLHMVVHLETPGEQRTPQSVQGTVIVMKEGGEGNQADLILPVYLFRDERGDGEFKADLKLFYCSEETDSYDCPTYIMEPGKYIIGLVIWNDAIWTQTVTITACEKKDETGPVLMQPNEELEEWIKEFETWNMAQAEITLALLDKEGQLIMEREYDGAFCYSRTPYKFRVGLKFDLDFIPQDDIIVYIQESCQSSNREEKVICRDELMNSRTRTASVEFNSFLKSEGTQATELHVIVEHKGIRRRQENEYLAVRFSSPEEFLKVQDVNLYALPHQMYGYKLLSTMRESVPQTEFEQETMQVLGAMCVFKDVRNINFLRFEPDMSWVIYDDMGIIVSREHAEFDMTRQDYVAYTAIKLFDGREWKKGEYRIELLWEEHTLLSEYFTI